MSQLTGSSIIALRLVAGGGSPLAGVNPTTGEQLSPGYPSATLEQVDLAVQAACDCFLQYRDIGNAERAAFLRAIAEQIEARVELLVDRVGQETALPEPRVRGETGRTCGQLRLFASLVEDGSWVDARIDPAMPDRTPLPRADVRSMLRPLGPVVVFGASNFPLAFSVAGGDTASALAAGCPVVVKAHPAHPGTSEIVGQAVVEAAKQTGMPDGVFSLLFDAGHDVGSALVKHPGMKAVGFTGSLRAGRALFDLAAARDEPIPVYAEMGSINPQFLLPAAIAARGAELAAGLHGSMTMGAGQFCTKPGVILTNGDATLRDTLGGMVAESQGCLLTSGIADAYERGVDKLSSHPGVKLVAAAKGAPPNVGARLLETSIATVSEFPELLEECFGPAALLVHYEDPSQLSTFAGKLEGQLTASIHADDADLPMAGKLASVLETRVGRVCFNQFPTGVEVNHAMVHGGPYPATTDSRSTSVGAAAILRFARPVCFQNLPDAALPPELQAGNPLGVRRTVDGMPR